ncbi:MAG: MarR family transcriptional regulator [Bryobacter sp.]|nr:MarR family transcriptional regulator [Bryobacter sp.]
MDPIRQAELDEALDLFHFAWRSIVATPDKILARHGLSRVHHRILYFIRRNPNLSVNGLVDILGTSKQALHPALRALQERKLVVALPSPEDRRVRRLSLTPKGKQFEEVLSGDQRERLERAFLALGPAKERAWREMMARI